MKTSRALLAAGTLLLAGCTSTPEVIPPPVALGSDTTPWGVLPRYEARMKPETRLSRGGPPPPGKVVAEVLVEREGAVRDVRIVEAEGAPGAARAAYTMMKASHYLPLPPDGPELYVVRQTVEIKPGTRSRIPAGGINNDGGGNSSMPANAPWPNLGGG